MKHIEMPAKRLTANCIWNSFHSSGKRHIILTGSRGSGKTTLLNQMFPNKTPGITTWAKPKQAVYLQNNLSGETVQVGIFNPNLQGPCNQMVPLKDGFSSVGIPTLMQCIDSSSQWVTIDEIGYLEAQCIPYHKALEKLLNQKQVVAVVRKQNLPFLQDLCNREDAFVVDLDNPFGNIGCVIMASGFSKRFGSNKLITSFHDKPLINYILDATEDIFSQRVVVTRYKDVAKICENRNIKVVLHNLPHLNDTVRLGLEAMPGIERCMFATSDQPLLRKETIISLVLSSMAVNNTIWRTVHNNIPGSPVIFPKWAFPELLALPEDKGGGVVIKKYPERLRMINIQDMYELKDIDYPKDFQELLEW